MIAAVRVSSIIFNAIDDIQSTVESLQNLHPVRENRPIYTHIAVPVVPVHDNCDIKREDLFKGLRYHDAGTRMHVCVRHTYAQQRA